MEDRKTAPALRARLLRSYVPLRCVRTKVRPPALPHPFPAEISPSQFQIQARRNKDRTLSTATDRNCALCCFFEIWVFPVSKAEAG